MEKPVIKIDVISDIVCPWCYIGKRRLESAMAQVGSKFDFQVEYHPFELNPSMPQEGSNQQEHLAEKFGSLDHYEKVTAHVTAVAAQEGLSFNFTNQRTIPNTRGLHSLIQYAKISGNHVQLVEAFFRAYFSDGIDLTNTKNIRDICATVEMPQRTVDALLFDDQAALQIALAEKEIAKLGVSGVPFYIVDNKYGVSGAQPSEAFVNIFQKMNAVVDQSMSCDISQKEC